MKDDNCIFCKIANGDIPGAVLYEDDKFKVVLDVGPATKGHCLVLPKEHYTNIYEMPEELLGQAMVVAQKVGTRLVKAVGADGLNIVQNNGLAAGQTVFHFHIHLIPRFDGEDSIVGWNPGILDDKVKEYLVKEFAN